MNQYMLVIYVRNLDFKVNGNFTFTISKCYSELKTCIESGFANGEGKFFAEHLIRTIFKGKICPEAEIIRQCRGKALFQTKSVATLGSDG